MRKLIVLYEKAVVEKNVQEERKKRKTAKYSKIRRKKKLKGERKKKDKAERGTDPSPKRTSVSACWPPPRSSQLVSSPFCLCCSVPRGSKTWSRLRVAGWSWLGWHMVTHCSALGCARSGPQHPNLTCQLLIMGSRCVYKKHQIESLLSRDFQ